MTESNSNLPATNQVQENATVNNAGNPQAKSGTATWPIIVILIIIIAIVSGASIYFWQNLNQQRTLIDHLTQQSQSQSSRYSENERFISGKIAQLEAFAQSSTEKLNSVDRQALFNTQQLTELGASSRADWLLAETEYLLHLANQKLNLEKDFAGTEAILHAADKVLSELNDPGLLPIREAIAKEVFDIQQVKLIDQEGIYIQLSTMIASLDKLDTEAYLKTRTSEELVDTVQLSQESSVESGLWQEIWQDLKRIVVIRRLDEPVAPLLAPEQSYYLKQNLRLMLEQASVALLERNQTIFHDSLTKAHSWLISYFEIKNPIIQSLSTSVNQLKSTSINYTLPDVSGSLRLTKKKIESMYRNHSLGKLTSPNDEKIIDQESAQ